MQLADLLRERFDAENKDVWAKRAHPDIRALFCGSTSLNRAVVT